MKKIALTGKYAKGRQVIVDDEMYDYINQWTWYYMPTSSGRSGYATRTIRYGPRSENRKRTQFLHSLVLKATADTDVDHISTDTLDCRRRNLRRISHQANCFNRGTNKNNTSGYKGVYWCKYRNRWKATIRISGQAVGLGSFITPAMAALAYNVGALIYHGEFAWLNPIEEAPISR